MKKMTFTVKKWGVRAMVAVGAALGLSSCVHHPGETVYGPPPSDDESIEVSAEVYGPPVEDIDDISDDISDNISMPETVYGPPVDDLDAEGGVNAEGKQ